MFDWFLNAAPCCAITDWCVFLKMGLFYSLIKTKKSVNFKRHKGLKKFVLILQEF